MLKKKELEKIDNVIASSPWCTASLKKLHDEQGGRDALYKRVWRMKQCMLTCLAACAQWCHPSTHTTTQKSMCKFPHCHGSMLLMCPPPTRFFPGNSEIS